MTNVNSFSDSQESALFSEEVYGELRNEFDVENLQNLMDCSIEEEEDRKCDITLLDDHVQDVPGYSIEAGAQQQQQHHQQDPQPQNEQDYQFQQQHHPHSHQEFLMLPPAAPPPQPPPSQVSPVEQKDEFPGSYNFQLCLNGIQDSGKTFAYSQPLQKVFIDMDQTLPLRFKWQPIINGLWVRSTMMFSMDQHRHDRVQRCHNHRAMVEEDVESVRHVVRCLDPTSIYEEGYNGHLSVITPLGLPEAGSDHVQLYYQFKCKNSCTSGMNRRPTELVFTLENDQRVVLGRRRLLVRVCSCPKRDRAKEEKEEKVSHSSSSRKRKISTTLPQHGKKLMQASKVVSPDQRIFDAHFKIVGEDNYLMVLKYALQLMASQAFFTSEQELLKPYMEELIRKIQQ